MCGSRWWPPTSRRPEGWRRPSVTACGRRGRALSSLHPGRGPAARRDPACQPRRRRPRPAGPRRARRRPGLRDLLHRLAHANGWAPRHRLCAGLRGRRLRPRAFVASPASGKGERQLGAPSHRGGGVHGDFGRARLGDPPAGVVGFPSGWRLPPAARQRSSGVEQLTRNEQVDSSNLSVGSRALSNPLEGAFVRCGGTGGDLPGPCRYRTSWILGR